MLNNTNKERNTDNDLYYKQRAKKKRRKKKIRNNDKKKDKNNNTKKKKKLEELRKENEYAKEWKASKYNELLEENKWLKEQLEYWDKEYIKRDGKVEGYRRTKELRGQEKQMRKVKRGVKCNKCNEYGYHACKKIEKKCYTCGRIGHKQKECYKNRICEK